MGETSLTAEIYASGWVSSCAEVLVALTGGQLKLISTWSQVRRTRRLFRQGTTLMTMPCSDSSRTSESSYIYAKVCHAPNTRPPGPTLPKTP